MSDESDRAKVGASTRISPNSLANLTKRWEPGQSGNPNGRPPAPIDIAALCRAHGPRGVEVAAALMEDPDPKIRLAAVLALWDRGFGRPVQAIAATDNASSLTIMHLTAMRQFSDELNAERVAAERQPPVINGEAAATPPRNLYEPATE